MRLLVLGGSWFLGRATCELALRRGWSVSAFNRGRTGRTIDGVELVRGDRASSDDLRRLAQLGRWDAVVDTSGYEPAAVVRSTQALAELVGRYVYVSTVNVYTGWPDKPLDDTSPVYSSAADLSADPDEARGVGSATSYGVLKAGCELAVTQNVATDRSLILRPGVLLGPYEYVGRLAWLLRRMERGGRVLAGGPPARGVQPLDVRDLAAFILNGIEGEFSGAMNATAPIAHSTYGELLEACRVVTGGRADLAWVEEGWLAQQPVEQWTEIPLWRTNAGAWAVSSARAERLGLVARPLTETVRDMWEWLRREDLMPHDRQNEIGIDTEKELRLLAAWDAVASERARSD